MKSVLVLGGGPGGYVAAIRAAQLGAEVTLVEKGILGGTCLNVGCMPTKVLLHTVEVKESIAGADQIGLNVPTPVLDPVKLRRRQQRVVRQLTSGVKLLLKENNVNVVQGTASFCNKRQVSVTTDQGEEKILTSDIIIIATGSEGMGLAVEGAQLEGIWDSDAALEVESVPDSLLVIGGGVIGAEFASIYSGFGSKVTVVEMMSQLLPKVDGEIAAALEAEFKARGIRTHTDSKVVKIEKDGQEFISTLETPEGRFELPTDKILIAVGRKPVTEKLGLAHTNIKTKRGFIEVDADLQTAQQGIYAVGDVIGGSMLAHAAFAEGERAVEHALGITDTRKKQNVPGCIFTRPEVAFVGLSEEEAAAEYDIKIGKFPFQANGKALINQERAGFVKIIAAADSGKILGVHIIGGKATELIPEGTLALYLGAGVADLYGSIHPHPTLGEALAEAAMDVEGRSIHMPPK